MTTGIEYIRKLARLMLSPQNEDHFQALGMKFTAIEKGFVAMELPYSDKIIGNPETGVVHGGALTALLDTCCGFAANTVLDELAICPTLDLRIDYMRPAAPNASLHAQARVYRATRGVIFCRGKAYLDDPQRPVAYCVANFTRLDPDVSQAMAAQIQPFLDAMEN